MAVSALAARAWEQKEHSEFVNWWSSRTCRAYYNTMVCGEPVPGNSEGCRVVLRKALDGRRLQRGVSVGCGAALKEIAILQDDLVDSFDLWEISQTLATQGAENAEAAGVGERVTYKVGDVFTQAAEPIYDLVNWDHSLHHMSDVDAALAWTAKVLRPGGFVIINDYIGPNRLQATPREVDRANAVLNRLGVPGRVQRSNIVSRLKQWYRDPSEAPQSELISTAVKRRLPGAELRPIGGVMLNMLGGRIVPLAADDEASILQALVDEDAAFFHEGSSHFAFALWQKPLGA